MGMEQLKSMKETLMSQVQGQMGNLAQTDTKELGEAIDMIKDLSEAVYYCQIVEAMEKQEKEKEKIPMMYYTPILPHMDGHYPHDEERMFYPRSRDSRGRFMYTDPMMEYYRDMMEPPMMSYYGGGRSGSSGGSNSNGNYYGGRSGGGYTMRDMREGRSPMSRRMYMESKEMHKDKAVKMQELDAYMKELTEDIVEMIEGASPEERQILEKKLSALATKVNA